MSKEYKLEDIEVSEREIKSSATEVSRNMCETFRLGTADSDTLAGIRAPNINSRENPYWPVYLNEDDVLALTSKDILYIPLDLLNAIICVSSLVSMILLIVLYFKEISFFRGHL